MLATMTREVTNPNAKNKVALVTNSVVQTDE